MLIELRERMTRSLKELGELQQKEERTADDESRIDALLGEVNDLGPKIQRELTIAAATSTRAQYDAPAGRQTPGNGQPSAGAQQAEERDTRTLGQRFMESDPFKAYNGRGKSQPFDVGSFYHRGDDTPLEQRTLIYSAALSADMVRPQVVPGIFRGDDLQGTLRDVLINGTTDSDAIIFVRELVFTNAAAGVAQATATSGASGLKPEAALTFEQDTAPVVTIAHWIPVTRQVIDDTAQLQTYIEQRLLDGLRLEESNQLLNGTAAPDMVGLLNTTGVQALDAAYFVGDPVLDDGTNNENFNRILRARTLIRTVGRARANFVVLNPANMEVFLSSTDGMQQYLGAGPFSGNAISNLWGLRVVEDENIAEGTALVGDGRMAAVWDRMQAQIFIDTIDDQFVRNMMTILAEERVALTVFRPAAFAEVTLV
jgi:HK97 family phage major capsid protein